MPIVIFVKFSYLFLENNIPFHKKCTDILLLDTILLSNVSNKFLLEYKKWEKSFLCLKNASLEKRRVIFCRNRDVRFLKSEFFFQDLTVTDDTVLEDHNEDPSLVQMRLIGDGGE